MPSSKRGPYGVFNERTRKTILRWLRAGHFRRTAALRAGIIPSTLSAWQTKGRREIEDAEKKAQEAGGAVDIDDLSAHAAFYMDCAAAIAKSECRLLKVVQASDKPDDAKWILERRHREQWGRTTRVEHTGADRGTIEVNVNDARKAFAKKLTASLRREGIALTDPSGGPDDGGESGPEGAASPSG